MGCDLNANRARSAPWAGRPAPERKKGSAGVRIWIASRMLPAGSGRACDGRWDGRFALWSGIARGAARPLGGAARLLGESHWGEIAGLELGRIDEHVANALALPGVGGVDQAVGGLDDRGVAV